MDEIVIVTTHQGTVEFLALHGITGRVVERARIPDIKNRVVCGMLPLRLAAYATKVIALDIPMTKEQIDAGADLSCEELTAAGATLVEYQVSKTTYRTHNQTLLGRDEGELR